MLCEKRLKIRSVQDLLYEIKYLNLFYIKSNTIFKLETSQKHLESNSAPMTCFQIK